MRWLFWILVVVEIVSLAVAMKLVPRLAFANEAVLIVAVNSFLLVLVAKRLRKKPDCCG